MIDTNSGYLDFCMRISDTNNNKLIRYFVGYNVEQEIILQI